MSDELSRQLNRELSAAYLYLSMSAYAESLNLDGFARWLFLQSQEELGHAQKIYRYLMDRSMTATWSEIAPPRSEFESLLDVFEAAVENEKTLGLELEKLSTLAGEEKDNTTRDFLNWFLSEQVEEVASTENVRDKLRLIDGAGHGLLILDQELGRRE